MANGPQSPCYSKIQEMHPIQTRGVAAERLREEGQQDTSDSQSCSVFTRCSQLLIRERHMELKDPDCTRLAGKAISQLRKQNEGEKERERERNCQGSFSQGKGLPSYIF